MLVWGAIGVYFRVVLQSEINWDFMNLNWGIKQDVELQAEFECKEEELNSIEIWRNV